MKLKRALFENAFRTASCNDSGGDIKASSSDKPATRLAVASVKFARLDDQAIEDYIKPMNGAAKQAAMVSKGQQHAISNGWMDLIPALLACRVLDCPII